MVAGNFFTLIFGSIFFYAPWQYLRELGGILNIFMQINIMLSGNYNYFNLLSIACTLVIFDKR